MMDVSGRFSALRYHGDTKRPEIAESGERHQGVAQSMFAS